MRNHNDELINFGTTIRELETQVLKLMPKYISNKKILESCKDITHTWYSTIRPIIKDELMLETQIINKYDSFFDKILNYGLSKNIRKNSLSSALKSILKGYKDEILLESFKRISPNPSKNNPYLNFESLSEDEKDYFEEAIGCSKYKFHRASVVLAWCAAISRIHTTLTRIGFDKLNENIRNLKNSNSLRYKKFGKLYVIESSTELNDIRDNDLLWIIEYMGLIDSSQHKRLLTCYNFRLDCAHPSRVPISEENLISFYSDIDKTIFSNKNFEL